jgi:hypothetical protein
MPSVLCRSVVVADCGVMLASGEVPAVPSSSTPTAVGSPGIGDPYYPTYGNGGYDVRHYALDLSYDLKTGRLRGTAVIRGKPTQRLDRFNLDLMLRARSVEVNRALRPGSYDVVRGAAGTRSRGRSACSPAAR